MNKLFTLTCLLLPSLGLQAQKEMKQEADYRYNDATQIWRNTEHTAGMAIDSTVTRGVTQVGFQQQGGNYHRVQEGSGNKAFFFSSERYQSLGKHLYGYGRFVFSMDKTKERAWSDVYRSYNSNPYFSGSNRLADYDNQQVELVAAVATRAINNFRYGLRWDYQLGDLSRLRDPRSRSNLLNYRLMPSISYTKDAHTIGLSGHYNRRKEKIANIRTVQSDATIIYYQMSGLENIEGLSGGFNGFSREWVDHRFGASLAYAYKGSDWHSLTTIGIERGTEYVYEKVKREPGRYQSFVYDLSSQNRIHRHKLLHQIDFQARYQQAYGDEYRQELEITKDPLHGFTSEKYNTMLTFKKRYQVQTFDLNFRYRANIVEENKSVKAYTGIVGRYQHAENKHLLPTSQLSYSSLWVALESGTSLLRNRRLWVDASLGYRFATNNSLALANPSSLYATEVLVPDMAYHDANYYRGRLQVMYQLPVSIKRTRSMWFIKGFADYLHTNNQLHSHTVGVSIGVFN